MNNPLQEHDIGPWYKQLWAWIVLAPLITIMIIWIPFLTIIVKDADDEVIDNYYKEGKMINVRVDEDRTAKRLGLNGQIRFDMQVGDIVLKIDTADTSYTLPDQLLLALDHPVEEDNDLKVVLTKVVAGRYQGELLQPLEYHWYVRLMTLPEASDKSSEAPADQAPAWRVVSEVNFTDTNTLSFGSQE